MKNESEKYSFEKPGVYEIIHREGSKINNPDPTPIDFSGKITAPAEFFRNNGKDLIQYLIECRKNVVISNSKVELPFIKLICHPDYFFKDTITGKLSISLELDAFGINNSKSYSPKELAKQIRRYTHLFPDREEFNHLYGSLIKFSGKVNTIFSDEQSKGGDIKKSLERQVQHDLPEEFKIKVPIFEGEDAVEFEVEIFTEATNDGVSLTLESVPLMLKTKEQAEQIIERELSLFPDSLSKLEV